MLVHERIGTMRHRVSLANPTLTPTATGGEATTYPTTLATVFAAIENISQSERQGHQTVGSESTHIVTIRYLAGVTTKTRVTFGSRTFGIDGIANLGEQNAYLRLSCTEKVS